MILCRKCWSQISLSDFGVCSSIESLCNDFVLQRYLIAISFINLNLRRSSRYSEEKLADLDYADDIALFEETDVKMVETTEAIRVTAGKLGLQMSYNKTD